MATIITRTIPQQAATIINFETKVKAIKNISAGHDKQSAPAFTRFFKWLTEL